MNAQSNGHKCQHKVGQYEINSDVLIKEYPSFAAAAREMGVSSGAIISAAKTQWNKLRIQMERTLIIN